MPIIERYGKAVAAVVAAALAIAYTALSGDQRIDAEEWVRIAIAAVTAIGVYLVPLFPQYPWSKTALAVALSMLQVLVTVILGGVSADEWIAIVLAGLTVLGVGAAPAASSNGVAVGWFTKEGRSAWGEDA